MLKHGLSKHPLYNLWSTIKQRCYNPKRARFKDYGGRGIVMCEEWKNNFLAFYKWALDFGWDYDHDLQIDRCDNEGPYSPGNCRFVKCRKNILNKRNLRSTNKSGFTGVSFSIKKEKWRSEIRIHYKLHFLGLYNSIEEAVEARNKYIRQNNLEKDYKIQTI